MSDYSRLAAQYGWDQDLSAELATAKADAAGWERPIPFHENKVPPFPTEALPRWWRDFVDATAMATQTPPDMAAVLSLAAVATCVHGRLRLSVKPDYHEPLNLYIACAMESANRKSGVTQAVAAPLGIWENEEMQRVAAEVAAAKSQLRIDEQRLERAEAAAAKCDDPNERRALEEEAKQIAGELGARRPVYAPRLQADDVTPEQLATLLMENDGRIAILEAEGTIFEIMCGRYTNNGNPNIELFLKAHAGDPIRVDRRSRPPERIERPAMTLGVAMQPDVIRGLMGNRSLLGRGLLARFLYSLPASFVGLRKSDPPSVSGGVKAAYGGALARLLSMRIPDGATIGLSDEASAEWSRYFDRTEIRLGPDGDLRHIQAWGGKLPGAVARIAGLLHAATHADSPWSIAIGRDTMAKAIQIGDYFTAHAFAAFAEMGADPALESAKKINRWLKRRGEPMFSLRDVLTGCRWLGKMPAVEAAIEVLSQHGWIRLTAGEPDAARPRGRPCSPKYEVNPILFVSTQKSQNTQKGNSAVSAISAANGAP